MLSQRIFTSAVGSFVLLVALMMVGGRGSASAQTAPLSPAEIYEGVADAIPVVETPVGRGSGILIDSRRVVTDAHVVSAFETVTVRFRDGRTDNAARVIGLDLMADLAVLQLSTTVHYSVATLGPAEDLRIGEELYLIGYPGFGEDDDQPTISRGLLSRFRQWDAIGMTYIETDATAAPGLSGGAVLDSSGVVVGVTQFSTRSGFALAADAGAVANRVQGLIAGQDVAGIGDRSPTAAPRTSHTLTLDDFVAEAIFQVPASASGGLTVTVDGVEDAAIGLFRADGHIVDIADSTLTGRETLVATVGAEPIRHFVVVRHFSADPATFTLVSTMPLIRVIDPDDMHPLSDGDTYFGALDHPDDIDRFLVDLEAGQTLTAHVESVTFDTVAVLDLDRGAFGSLDYDDDGGGGIFGTNSLIEFTALSAGTYRLLVFPYFTDHPGAYVVSVTISDPAPTTGPAFSAPLPPHGVALAVYGGGHLSQLISSAALEGCTLSSFWVSEAGHLVGYIVGAPAFVNDVLLFRFPGGQIPPGTAMLVSCR